MFGLRAKPRTFLIATSLLGALTTCLLLLAQQQAQSPQPKEAENRPDSTYQLLAKGVVGSAPLQFQFKAAPLRLDIRNLVMGRGQTEAIPTPTRMLLELRQGGVTTTINQETLSRNHGDFWVVEKGSTFTIQNSGEAAVLRAIYIFEGSR